jgi:hypothetical protein
MFKKYLIVATVALTSLAQISLAGPSERPSLSERASQISPGRKSLRSHLAALLAASSLGLAGAEAVDAKNLETKTEVSVPRTHSKVHFFLRSPKKFGSGQVNGTVVGTKMSNGELFALVQYKDGYLIHTTPVPVATGLGKGWISRMVEGQYGEAVIINGTAD